MYPLIIALTFLIDIVDVAMPFPLVTDTPYDKNLHNNEIKIPIHNIIKIFNMIFICICYELLVQTKKFYWMIICIIVVLPSICYYAFYY